MKTSNSFLIKHKHLFVYYQLYLQKHKDKIRTLPRKNIYIEVSRPFYIEPQAGAKIISKMLRNGYTPSRLDLLDFVQKFKGIQEVQDIINSNI